MPYGFDDELAAQPTQASKRIQGLFNQIHPDLEHVIGPRPDHQELLDILRQYISPKKLPQSEKKLAAQLCKLAPRQGKRFDADITKALTK